MSARSCSFDHSDKLLLRWSEGDYSPEREEFVEILETRVSEAVICSTLKLVEKTEVYLIGKYSTESGVVRSCRPAGGKFIVTILINSQGSEPRSGPEIDPGVLLIDSFMTEEQEMSILDEVDDEIRGQQLRSLSAAKAYLNARLNTGRCEGTAVLSRVLKFTVRSSTALVSNSAMQVWSKFRQAAGTGSFARPQITQPIGTSGALNPPDFPVAVTSSGQ